MTWRANGAPNPIRILLVEDDDGDAKAVVRTFEKAKIANPIVRAAVPAAGGPEHAADGRDSTGDGDPRRPRIA
jgi:hypothetical protein